MIFDICLDILQVVLLANLTMERFTIEQRLKVIEAYYENGRSKRNAFRALRYFVTMALLNERSHNFSKQRSQLAPEIMRFNAFRLLSLRFSEE